MKNKINILILSLFLIVTGCTNKNDTTSNKNETIESRNNNNISLSEDKIEKLKHFASEFQSESEGLSTAYFEADSSTIYITFSPLFFEHASTFLNSTDDYRELFNELVAGIHEISDGVSIELYLEGNNEPFYSIEGLKVSIDSIDKMLEDNFSKKE